MELLDNTWILSLFILLLGLSVGFIIGRKNHSNMDVQNQLTKQLIAVETELAEYKDKVSLHFADTAAAVKTMTNSYRRVHNELSKGAQTLCDDPKTIASLLSISGNEQGGVSEQALEVMMKPPIDYAPKRVDVEHGTLDERYGLRDNQTNLDHYQYDVPIKAGNMV